MEQQSCTFDSPLPLKRLIIILDLKYKVPDLSKCDRAVAVDNNMHLRLTTLTQLPQHTKIDKAIMYVQ